ncbi:MAG TPA: serpin family protein [Clostridiales bacterium]|jgi:serine protease inhibitor|nr:serpin family protein [Clostridiales bacterium]
MKGKRLFDAITEVDDELVDEARTVKLKKRIKPWRIWGIVAACLVLVLGIGQLTSIWQVIFSGRGSGGGTEPIMDVIYPKALAFEDTDGAWEVRDENPVDEAFEAAIKDFAYKTSVRIFENRGDNINYSPLSLYYALALAASGAEGDTQRELLSLLGVADGETLSIQSGNLYRLLYTDNEIGKLKIANSLWLDDDMNGEPIEFKKSFVKNAAENFYASSHSVDFADADTTEKAMTKWVFDNTNGTLNPSFEFDRDQILSIINTIYFYDQWIDRFNKDKTAFDVFHLSNGDEVKTEFMNQTFGSAGFARGDGFTRSSLGLKNAGRMIFILPDEGITPYDLLSSPEQMREAFEGGEEFYGEVVWKVPKFKFGTSLKLLDVIRDLGVNSAFERDADFSGIADHMAFITDIRQDTHISIDEDGVEASAFTQIDYCGAALPEDRAEMILDRPFIYGITSQNGALLFVGVCENPAK